MVREKILDKSQLEKYITFQNEKVAQINALGNRFKLKV